MNRLERLKKTYTYLIAKGIIKNKSDMATRMGFSRSVVSSAINGSEKALTSNFLKSVAHTFPYISEDWLLEEVGEMIIVENLPKDDEKSMEEFLKDRVKFLEEQITIKDAIIRDLNNRINEFINVKKD